VFIVLITQLISDVGYAFLTRVSEFNRAGGCRSNISAPSTSCLRDCAFWPVWLGLPGDGDELRYKKRSASTASCLTAASHCRCRHLPVLAVLGDLRVDHLALRSLSRCDHEGCVARRDRAGIETCLLFGGDKLARDVFSRMVYGSQIVLDHCAGGDGFRADVGITLACPPAITAAGSTRSVLPRQSGAGLPGHLLFYLLVTPGIMDTPIPYAMALFFLFPIIFFSVLFWTRYKNRPDRLYILLGLTLIIGGWVYAGLVFDADPFKIIHIDPNQLNISWRCVRLQPGVFRIVRAW